MKYIEIYDNIHSTPNEEDYHEEPSSQAMSVLHLRS